MLLLVFSCGAFQQLLYLSRDEAWESINLSIYLTLQNTEEILQKLKRFSSVFPQIILYKYAHTCLLDRMQCSCVRPFLIQSSWLLRCRSISTFVALLLFLFGTVSGILICIVHCRLLDTHRIVGSCSLQYTRAVSTALRPAR